MSQFLPPLRLTGATILRDGQLQKRSIALADGRITRGPLPEVDLTGYLVLPGIIDLHCDSFERHLSPKPLSPMPMASGLASFDREAAANGVTTAYLAQGWSWEGGHRGPDYAEALMAALDGFRAEALTDLRLQIRAETHLVGQSQRLIAAVRRHRIGYVVFNDHLMESMHMARIAPLEFASWARKLGLTPEALAEAIDHAAAQSAKVPRSLRDLAEAFDEIGVLYGSHDDPDGDIRELYSMIGARICEFPLTRRAAAAAHAMMSPVIMGAPNVARGRSQAGHVSAQSLIADGLCDVLVSDFHLPALSMAAWALVDRGVRTLPQAWAMISERPAEVMRLVDRGRLDPGLRADMVIVNEASRSIAATICGGRMSYLAGEAAERFMAQTQDLHLAAE